MKPRTYDFVFRQLKNFHKIQIQLANARYKWKQTFLHVDWNPRKKNLQLCLKRGRKPHFYSHFK